MRLAGPETQPGRRVPLAASWKSGRVIARILGSSQSSARVRLCPTCARELEDPSWGQDLLWDLRDIGENEFKELDPSGPFRLAEKAAVIGQRKADFWEAGEVLGLVARILAARIRTSEVQRLREWLLGSQLDRLERGGGKPCGAA